MKVTYRTTGRKPEELLQEFRNSYYPRVIVTVDMIATGTDIKPLEIVMFMRAVKSRNFFEQMKGRGVRVIDATDLESVTPGAHAKTHFVIVDAVGVCEQELADTRPLEKQRSVSFDKLLQTVAFGSTEPAVLSSLASRLARLDRMIDHDQRDELAALAGGRSLHDLATGLIEALDPDRQATEARQTEGVPADTEPTARQLAKAASTLLGKAGAPLRDNPALRERLSELRRSLEQTIDTVSQDTLLEAGFSAAAAERAKSLVTSFEAFIAEHKDEITALQVLYSQPYAKRLRYGDIKALAAAIGAPPRSWTPDSLWRAYEALDRDRVRGAGGRRLLTDIVSLVRFALRQENELVPFDEKVRSRFTKWMAQQDAAGREFTPEQRRWLELMRDHIGASYQLELDDFEAVPFNQLGGLGRVHDLFGQALGPLVEELNEVLAA